MTLSKSSNSEDVHKYYDSTLKQGLAKAKGLLQGNKVKLNDVELNALISRLRKDIVLILLEFPQDFARLNPDLMTKLWQTCFYTQIAQLRAIYEKAKSRNSKQLKEVRVYYLQMLQNAFDFYKKLVSKIETKLNELNTALLENELTESVWEKALYASLLALGDLSRYTEVVKTTDLIFKQSETFYLQAIERFPHEGNAFNQIAKLSIYKKKLIVAAGFYIRALRIKHPFKASATNLETLFSIYVLENEAKIREVADIESQENVSVDNNCFVILHTLVKLIKNVNQSVTVTEIETKRFQIAFSNLCETKYISKRVMTSIFVLIVELFEKYVEHKKKLNSIVYILEILTKLSFSKLEKSLEQKNVAVSSPLLVFLSLISDYFAENIELTKGFYEEAWNCGPLERIANEAPLTALTAREPLREEQEFRGFLPLAKKYEKFLKRSQGCIKEKQANPYRAKKIVAFVTETLAITPSLSQSLGGMSVEEGSKFSEEILIGNNEIMTSVAESDSDKLFEGLVTGYNDDEDELMFLTPEASSLPKSNF